MDLECIYESSDFGEIESVKNLLEENKIPVMIKNMQNQNLLGGLVSITGHDPIAGNIQIYVNKDDIDKGLGLLESNQHSIISTSNNIFDNTSIETEDKDNENIDFKNADIRRRMILSIVFAIISFVVIPYILNIVLLKRLYKERKNFSVVMIVISTLIFLLNFAALLFHR